MQHLWTNDPDWSSIGWLKKWPKNAGLRCALRSPDVDAYASACNLRINPGKRLKAGECCWVLIRHGQIPEKRVKSQYMSAGCSSSVFGCSNPPAVAVLRLSPPRHAPIRRNGCNVAILKVLSLLCFLDFMLRSLISPPRVQTQSANYCADLSFSMVFY